MLSHLLEAAKADARKERSIHSSNCEVTSANAGSSINIANQLKSVGSCCFKQIAACLCTTPALSCCSWAIFRYLETNLARAGLPVEFLSLYGAVRPTDLKPSLSFEMIPIHRYSAGIILSHPIMEMRMYVLLHSGISKCRSLPRLNHLRQAPWMFLHSILCLWTLLGRKRTGISFGKAIF